MTNEAIAEVKRHFREWSGGFSPESTYQITVYVDYAILTDLGSPDEVREALLDWFESDDPDDDIYKPGDVRHTHAEFYSLQRMREAQVRFEQEELRSRETMRKWREEQVRDA